LAPAGLMALALVGVLILLGGDARLPEEAKLSTASLPKLWRGAIVTLGLLVIFFSGFRFGVATATEISAFAALYALVVGGAAFRELGPRAAARSFVNAATRSGLVLFIVAAAQSLTFVLTLRQFPQAFANNGRAITERRRMAVLLSSILILIVMGSILEGAAALMIFAPC
jgi:TRAP-type C4-dicarboxylate transport system permease large subunit